MGEQQVRVVGRYALYGAIAAGGMATVHLGRLLGPVGFSRTVAIKRLHPQYASDPEFVTMFLDEARLAARIRHPNVVPTLDVVATEGELFLVMDYVPGESVARLIRALREAKQSIPLRILSAIMVGALHGLHAAHEAKDERGQPLGIVHRDVSPQNVLVGSDGVSRVLDFGVAKAAGRMQTTQDGQVKGKLSYMPPEQLRGQNVTRQTDIYAVGVMLWELITGKRLFGGENEGAIIGKILEGRVTPPSHVSLMGGRTMPANRAHLEALDRLVLRALSAQPELRHASAREMALELERVCPPATSSEVGDWVEAFAQDVLRSRAQMVADIESGSSALGKDAVLALVNAPRIRESSPSFHGPLVSYPPGSHPPGSYPPGTNAYASALPPVTSPSSISVSSSHMPARPSRGGAGLIAATGVVLAAAIVIAALVLRGVLGATAPPTPPVAAAAPPPAAEPARTAVPGTTPEPPAPTVVVAVVAPTATASTPKPVLSARKPSAPPAVRQGDGCTWYDASNVKHYNPACLQNER